MAVRALVAALAVGARNAAVRRPCGGGVRRPMRAPTVLSAAQFFLTTRSTPHLDGKHVVFGKVTAGRDVVEAIEKVGSGGGATRQPVVIENCGEIEHIKSS